jgi:hypothetical protein
MNSICKCIHFMSAHYKYPWHTHDLNLGWCKEIFCGCNAYQYIDNLSYIEVLAKQRGLV